MNKSKRSVLAPIFVLFVLLVLGGFFIYKYSIKADITNPNLIINPSFEEPLTARTTSSSSLSTTPNGWNTTIASCQNTDPAIKTKQCLDSTEKHSGNSSWKIEYTADRANQTVRAYSNPIQIDPSNIYKLSVWAKNKNNTELGYFGWQELDQSKNPIPTNSENLFVINQTTGHVEITNTWQQYQAGAKIKNIDTRFIRISFYGPINKGTIWWDDVSLTVNNPPIQVGCVNNATTKCENLSNITVKNVPDQNTYTVKIPAFNNDTNGFPTSPMLLEVKTIDSSAETGSSKNPPSILSSLVNWSYGETGKTPYFDLTRLTDKGDNKELTRQILLPRSDRSRIRVVDGNYQFKITANYADLPLKYLSLRTLSDQEYVDYQKWLFGAIGVKEVNAPTSPVPANANNITLFTTSLEQPIYPNYYPSNSEINNNIKINSTLNTSESASLSIYSKSNLGNLTIEVTDLINGSNKIDKSKIDVRQVINDYRFWSRYSSQYKRFFPSFGLMPDRLIKFTNINIPANTSTNFRYKINTPARAAPGVYSGKITLKDGNTKVGEFDVKLDLLDLELSRSDYKYDVLEHSPFVSSGRLYKDVDKTLANMKDHQTDTDLFVSVACDNTKDPVSCNIDGLKDSVTKSLSAGVIKDKAFLIALSTTADIILKSTHPEEKPELFNKTLYDKLSDPKFTTVFKDVINQVEKLGQEKNIQFSYMVVDEPAGAQKRIYTDRLFPLIKSVINEGHTTGTTWETYLGSPELRVDCTTEVNKSLCSNPNGLTLPDYSQWLDYKVPPITAINNNSAGFYTTFYNQTRNPVYNRFFHGLYSEALGIRVVLDYVYAKYVGDPYIDNDADYLSRFPASGYDFVLAYPSWSGEMIDTVAWESTKEGIQDTRYIQTLRELILNNPRAAAALESKKFLVDQLDRIDRTFSNYENSATNFGFSGAILKEVSSQNNERDYRAFESFRNEIFDYLKQLNSVTIELTPSKTNIISGKTIRYDIKYTNNTNTDLTKLTFTTAIPDGTTYVPNSATQNGDFGNNNQITWIVSQLRKGQTFTASFEVKVN